MNRLERLTHEREDDTTMIKILLVKRRTKNEHKLLDKVTRRAIYGNTTPEIESA